MRRVQLVRRRRFSGFLFFAALSWVGVGMGFDIRSGLLAKDFSAFLENKLNTIFVDKEVRLSRIEGGGFRKFAIEDFSVSRKISEASPSVGEKSPLIFSADKVIIKYNLIDLLLRRFEKLGGIYIISPTLFFNLNQSGDFVLPPNASPYLSGSSTYGTQPIKFHILNGEIAGLGKQPILSNLEGTATFFNSNLSFNNLRGTFLNLPVLVNGRIENVLGTPVVKLRLLMQDRYYTARCTFKTNGQKGEGLIWGDVRLFDRVSSHFKGRINISSAELIEIKQLIVTQPLVARSGFTINGDINLANKSSKLMIRPKTGHIKLITNLNKDKGLSIYARLSHINFLGHDVLSEIHINTNFYNTANSQEILKGGLKTQNLILDYKPFKEIETRWILKKKELFITSLELGQEYRLFGKIKLNKPYDVDLDLSINNADLNDWFVFSRFQQPRVVSGLISGKINMQGPLNTLATNGRLDIQNGRIGDIKFNAINASLKGRGPMVTISDSRIFKEGGFLYLDGEIDFRKFGKRNIFEDIKVETDQRIIVWEGWDITKDTAEIRAKKDLGEDFGVNFKTYVNTGNIDEEQKKSEIGLDYKIKKEDSINVRMKDDSAFVGVEHKIKF